MTTIAYKDGIIAVDSYSTQGSRVVCNGGNKIKRVRGAIFVATGSVADFDNLHSAYFGENYDKALEISALVIDSKMIYLVGICSDDGFWKIDIAKEKYKSCTLGSGGDFAQGAMDAGATAKEAVKIACERDVYSGGRVRTIGII